jgi:hypothetical protein
MLRCVFGDKVAGPKYLDPFTGKISTDHYNVTWVPESEYPFPLVTSRYLLDYEVEGAGSHVVLIKDKVVKVGAWQECVAWAEKPNPVLCEEIGGATCQTRH